MEGGIEPLDPIEWDRYPRPRKSGINENASGLTINPHRMGHGFSLGFPNNSSQRASTLALSRVCRVPHLMTD
jgi:hypothetical protein